MSPADAIATEKCSHGAPWGDCAHCADDIDARMHDPAQFSAVLGTVKLGILDEPPAAPPESAPATADQSPSAVAYARPGWQVVCPNEACGHEHFLEVGDFAVAMIQGQTVGGLCNECKTRLQIKRDPSITLMRPNIGGPNRHQRRAEKRTPGGIIVP